jgi:hypothetical protein
MFGKKRLRKRRRLARRNWQLRMLYDMRKIRKSRSLLI